jgi:hypothetical protein
VKWRAARVRINHLLEPDHPEKEIKLGKKPELHEAPARASNENSVAALGGDKQAESSDKDSKKGKPAAAEAALERRTDGKAEKPEEKSESELENTKQTSQDQHEQKSDSVHHPTEVTEPLAGQEGTEQAAQLKSEEKKSGQEAA